MATLTSQVVTSTERRQEEGANSGPVLKLSLKKEKAKQIKWSQDTVDNEGLGRKKSKCCCQFKKKRTNLEDSSSSESEDECGNCPGHGPSTIKS